MVYLLRINLRLDTLSTQVLSDTYGVNCQPATIHMATHTLAERIRASCLCAVPAVATCSQGSY